MKTLITFFLTLISLQLFSQIGFGTNNPHPSAALEIYDTARGVLIPRMTLIQRNAIITPAEGLMIYQTDSIKGYWYFDGLNWKNINSLQNGGGKQTLILSDLVTDEEAKDQIAIEVGPNTQEIRIVGCQNLKYVDLSMVSSVIELNISDNPVLQKVDLQNLKSCKGEFTISACPSLTDFNIPSLVNIVGKTNINSSGLSSLTFPSLKRLANTLTISSNKLIAVNFPILETARAIDVNNESLLTSFSCPTIKSATGNFTFNNLKSLTAISFPTLISVGGLGFTNCKSLTSITCSQLALTGTINISTDSALTAFNFPLLVNMGALIIQSNPFLSSVSFPSLQTSNDVYINLDQSLTTISFPVLQVSGSIDVEKDSSLTSIGFPILNKTNNLTLFRLPVLSSISFPALLNTGNIEIGESNNLSSITCQQLSTSAKIYIHRNQQLNLIDLPQLNKAGIIQIIYVPIISLTLPSLQTADILFVTYNDSLTSFSVPALIGLISNQSSQINSCMSLTSINLGNLSQLNNGGFNLSQNLLPSDQINYLLSKFVSILPPISGKTIDLRQLVLSSPTGQGIADKATLISNGNNITTD